MNPYERIIAKNSHKKPAAPAPRANDAVLSRVQKRRLLLKPRMRLMVEHRYKFDLPEPPMDLMMLNGTMAPDAFANPLSVPIERMTRPRAIPSDPRYGLCGNLLDPTIYQKKVPLTMQDEALLVTIEAESKTPVLIGSSAGRSSKDGTGLPMRRRPEAPAPWMRRMSYDEYFGRSNTQHRRQPAAPSVNGLTPLQSSSKPQRARTPLKPQKTIERSFFMVNKKPVHPNRKKRHLKVANVTPLFPDFSRLGDDFLCLQFNEGFRTTHRVREEKFPEKHKKATNHMTTISLEGEDKKKFLAMYTPSDDALEQLGDGMEGASSKTLVYDWLSEYGIFDPSKFDLTGGVRKPNRAARPMFAVRQQVSDDGSKRVATLSRVSVYWKTKQRVKGPQLGKPHMKVEMAPRSQDAEEERVDRVLTMFSGHK